MKTLLLFLCILLGGCGVQTAESFAVSDEFSEEQITTILAAVDEWCEKAGRCEPVTIIPKEEILSLKETATIRKGGEAECYREKDDGTLKTIGGFTILEPSQAPQVVICMFDSAFTMAVKHEMGHALAGRNDHTEAGVMAAQWRKSFGDLPITEEDAQYVKEP